MEGRESVSNVRAGGQRGTIGSLFNVPSTLPAASPGASSPVRIRSGEFAVLPRYIDWPMLVKDIKAALRFEHDSKVADLLNIPRTTLAGWIDGSEPLYTHGAPLIELHRRATGPDRTADRLREFRERATRPRGIAGGSRSERLAPNAMQRHMP